MIQSAIKIIFAGILLLGLTQCRSQKIVLVTTPPFILGDVTSEKWTSPDKGSGTNLYIPVEEGREIILNNVYFRGKETSLEKIQRDNYLVYIARFKDEEQKDMILHEDPEKEFGNTPPRLFKQLPVTLEDNEAVISFTENKKTKYYKIENIREATPVKSVP